MERGRSAVLIAVACELVTNVDTLNGFRCAFNTGEFSQIDLVKSPAALRTRVRLLGAVVQGGDVLAEVALRREGLLALLALEPFRGEREKSVHCSAESEKTAGCESCF